MADWQHSLYIISLIVAGTLASSLAPVAWLRRQVQGLAVLGWLIGAAAVWSYASALQLGIGSPEAKLWWTKVAYSVATWLPTAWFVFAVRRESGDTWLASRRRLLLSVLPVLYTGLVWTNEWHGWVWHTGALQVSGPCAGWAVNYGLVYWVETVYNGILLAVAGFALFQGMADRIPFGTSLGLMSSFAAVLPWVGQGMDVAGLRALSCQDWMPLAVAVSGGLEIWTAARRRSPDVVPLAKNAIVDGMLEGIIILDAQARVVYMNPAAERTLSRPAERLMGRTAAEVFSARSDLVERYRRTGEVQVEIRQRVGDEERLFDTHVTPLQVRERLGGHLVTVRDVTEARHLEETLHESEARFRRLVELSPDAIYVCCEERIVFINAAGVRMYGAAGPQDLVGRRILDLVHPDDRDRAIQRMNLVRRDGKPPPFVEEKSLRVDGTVIYIEVAATPIVFQDRPAMQIVARDVTERRRVDQQVKRRADEFAALYDITRDLSAQSELPVLLESIVHKAVRLLHGAGGGMYLYDAERSDLEVVVAENSPTPVGTRLAFGEGMAGRVAASRQPLSVDNYQTWANRSLKYEGSGLTAVIEVPMLYGGELIGVLAVEHVSETTQVYTQWDEELLSLFAAQAAGAVYNARLFDETKRRADQFAALYDTTQDLTVQQDVTVLLHVLLKRAVTLLGAPVGFIYLYDPDRNDLELVVNTGAPMVVGTRLLQGDGLAGQVAQFRRPIIVSDYQAWEHRTAVYAHIPFRALVGVPMLVGGALIGVLGVSEIGEAQHQFSNDDAHLLALFAGQAAAAVHNARLFQQTRQRAEQLGLLYEAGLTLNRVLDPLQAMDYVLGLTRRSIHADHAEFFGFDPTTRTLTLMSTGEASRDPARVAPPTYVLGQERGLVGLVAAERTLMYVPDVIADSRWIPSDPHSRAALCVPVAREDHLHGVLVVTSVRPNAFSAADQRLATLFANQLSVALENAHLFEETRRRVTESETVNQVSIALRSAQRIDDMLPLLLDQTLDVLKLAGGAIYLCDAGHDRLRPTAVRRWPGPAVELGLTALKAGSSVLGRVLETGEAVVARDWDLDAFWPVALQEGLASGVCGAILPMATVDETIGVLAVYTTPGRELRSGEMRLLTTIADMAGNAIQRMRLHERVEADARELAAAYEAAIESWSHALDLRDHETEGHSMRVTELTVQLARALQIDESEMVHIRHGALLHDIGKVGVPDSILLKPGPLTEDEWQIMRQHPVYARDMLGRVSFLRHAAEIPYAHHERWDGTGYPLGLAREQIPLAARIFAVVDVWDALRSDRPYRPAWPPEKALAHLRSLSGTHFEPRILETFLALVQR